MNIRFLVVPTGPLPSMLGESVSLSTTYMDKDITITTHDGVVIFLVVLFQAYPTNLHFQFLINRGICHGATLIFKAELEDFKLSEMVGIHLSKNVCMSFMFTLLKSFVISAKLGKFILEGEEEVLPYLSIF